MNYFNFNFKYCQHLYYSDIIEMKIIYKELNGIVKNM